MSPPPVIQAAAKVALLAGRLLGGNADIRARAPELWDALIEHAEACDPPATSEADADRKLRAAQRGAEAPLTDKERTVLDAHLDKEYAPGGDALVDMSMEAVRARLATYQPLGSHARGVAGLAIAPDELTEQDGADPTQTGGGDAGERARELYIDLLALGFGPKHYVAGRPDSEQPPELVKAALEAALRDSHREGAEAMREECAVAFANLPAVSNAIRTMPIPTQERR